MVDITGKQLAIMRHALGRNSPGPRDYRNRFVTGEGTDDYSDCERLVELGYMENNGDGNGLLCGNYYLVTISGIAKLEKYDEKDDDLYVLVFERDTFDPDNSENRPIVMEQYIDQGASSLESVKDAAKNRFRDRYGKCRIAKLVFLDEDESK